jgi:cytochrome P450
MQTLRQSPTDPAFVQNPYPFYDRARPAGPFFTGQDYDLALHRQCRGRECDPARPPLRPRGPARTAARHPAASAPFYAVEAHSMLELEPPRHTRLRSLVLRAFTSRRIAALAPRSRRSATN